MTSMRHASPALALHPHPTAPYTLPRGSMVMPSLCIPIEEASRSGTPPHQHLASTQTTSLEYPQYTQSALVRRLSSKSRRECSVAVWGM